MSSMSSLLLRARTWEMDVVPAAEREARWRALQAAKAEDARRLFDDEGVVSAADFFERCVDAHPGKRSERASERRSNAD